LLSFASQTERESVLRYFSERFGIEAGVFSGYRLVKSGNTAWAVSDMPGLSGVLEGLKVETTGIPLLRMKKNLWKPTTVGLQFFGRQATRNTISLNDEALEQFLREGFLLQTFSVEPGFVILGWRGNVLGCGLYRKGRLTSQVPVKSWQQIGKRGERDSTGQGAEELTCPSR
jgi:NOL1/NOP2/fmu family ribosome biogenesis protein